LPHQVCPYSISTLQSLLAHYTVASHGVISARMQTRYFEEYFRSVAAGTIVVEEDYIDHDYLEDYASYYVKCFQRYRKECTRLHFFRRSFDGAQFEALLSGGTGLTLAELTQDDGYLGFIVVKPLPECIIGRTCLAHYQADGRRAFPATREYVAHLYGLTLRVNTLAFQEQDSVTSACATSALWSVLQATGRLFQHQLPTPVEITKAATTNQPSRSRTFPNDGLTAEQMAQAIRSVGLEPTYVEPGNLFILKALIYGYLRAGVPALLLHRLVGTNSAAQDEEIGFHAVAVTGYSLPDRAVRSRQFKSDGIEKIYVHDDQVGPFARMTPTPIGQGGYYLTTSWGYGGRFSQVRAEPFAVILPLYHKVRIPFQDIYSDIVVFDRGLDVLRKVMNVADYEWDISLTTNSSLKQECRDAWPLSTAERLKYITASLPRFVWHATARLHDTRQLEVVFDATDIASGRYVCLLHVYDAILKYGLMQCSIDPQLRASQFGVQLSRVLDNGYSLE
jgi:hypothetical protein